MARFFVSYSRSVKDDVGKVVELLRSSGHEAWWDGDIPIMADWWATILKRIEWCEVFIFVVSEKSIQSAYCLAELKYASDRQRPILPFIIGDASGLALPSDLPPRGQWLIYKGDPAHTLAQINQAYSAIEWQLHKDIDAPRPPEPEKGGKSLIHQFQEALRLANNQEFEAAKQRLRNIKQLDYDEWGADCDAWLARLTSYAPLIDLAADAATLDRARREWQAYVRQNGDDFDPAEIGQRLKGGSRLRLSPARMSRPAVIGGLVTGLLIIAAFVFGVVLPRINNVAQPSPTTQVAAAQATETTAPTHTSSPDPTETLSPTEATPTVDVQGTADAIPTPTASPTPDTLQAAYAQAAAYDYQQGNDAWTPVVHTFDDGVPMVLVPPGCFMMGSDTSATDQQPVTQQCFEEPFWIDQTEVTQADFERIGGARSGLDGFDGDQRPVERINWFEARDFCAYRGGRLPAEREWEYAARGPEGWEYPWGNEWNENAVVWKTNANSQTAPVGSRPEGASWVGALDISGNVYEWLNSVYLPYDSSEDREADTGNRTDVFRVLRGGSWVSNDAAFLRAPGRQSDRPDSRINDVGFRCARSSNASASADTASDPLQIAYAQAGVYDYQQGNDAWTPVVHTFDDGVPMVLVPPGCFMMGSNDGQDDEQPVHEECFDAPFWIDQTEVTQADFERWGGVKANANRFDGDQRPVESITWFEARDFCALRGARLPTERDWEYAVRGPDALFYPWGNTWNANNAIWSGDLSIQTATVGSIPIGRAWVGAYDMIGNVWEWVSSLYLPYNSLEDRETDTGTRTDVQRVLRGGSWSSTITSTLRASFRDWYYPGGRFSGFGFRCARSS